MQTTINGQTYDTATASQLAETNVKMSGVANGDTISMWLTPEGWYFWYQTFHDRPGQPTIQPCDPDTAQQFASEVG